ncbi:MAG: response regulator [Eubacterium sp.]|nr:response regulator [Eubacterium sp.]
MKIAGKTIFSQITFIILLIAFVVGALAVFIKMNSDRVLDQNLSYIGDAAEQTASRISDILRTAEGSIVNLAQLYGNTLTEPKVDQEVLDNMTTNALFDYMRFIDENGMACNINDDLIDLSDREYFISGMQGEKGLCYIDESRMTGEACINFYAPIYFENKIIGVLIGVYTAESMQKQTDASFFNTQAKTYLCDRDGAVLVSIGDDDAPDNILDYLSETDKVDDKYMTELTQSFADNISYGFFYEGYNGESSAYAANIEFNEWMLYQAFPSSVTKEMLNVSERAGIVLVISIICVFAAYIAFLLIQKRRQTKRLINENQDIKNIVRSSTRLFVRFMIADLKNDTYEYIEKNDGMPQNGVYSELIHYMDEKYVDEDDEEPMSETVSIKRIQERLTPSVEYLQYEYHIRRGEERWENASIIPLKRENGKVVSILYAIQDITALKLKERQTREALKSAFEAAEAANKAKSEFLSRMSHDIRTPMNAIMGMTTVAAMHIDEKERLLDCLNKITTSSRHLLALINDVLDMSKIESGNLTLSEEPFNLSEMTDSLLTIMHPQIKAKNQQLNMSISKIEHEDVIGDTLRLRQVFVNLMGNAVKFTPEGGTISLSIREINSDDKGMGCYEFVFGDTGIGMEESFLEKVFEPFTRSKASESAKIEGTGLGMPIARNIARMMNGDITVKSKIGEGTEFTVKVFLKIQDIDITDTRDLVDLRVLVADDDKDAVENTCDILDSIGMQATGVLSGTDAVREATEHHQQNKDFFAIVLDWKMPDKNGIQAAKEIRSIVGEGVPIIILSAYDWSEIEQEARSVGVNAFIAKPLFRSRLVYVLKSLAGAAEKSDASEIDTFRENQYTGKRILLTEDNELNREIAKELLEAIGVEVEMAVDGQEAVDIVSQKPPHYYDLIFMDIQMPRLNGYQAAEAIRALDRQDLKEIPIVAMSADAFSDDIQHAHESGMNDHVAKPVEIAKLSEALKKWLK